MKYSLLIQTLKQLCKEAPPIYTSYNLSNVSEIELNQILSKVFIHLFLKVRLGISSFSERHDYISEGPYDGGLDAYYIDVEKRKCYLIQSKFRTTSRNFEEKTLTAEDLVKIEIDRIIKGEPLDSSGNKFNPKILAFQEKWRNTLNQATFKFEIIILGNVKNYNSSQMERLLGGNYLYTIYDFEKTYNELLMPLLSGTYYEANEIEIQINLLNKERSTLKQIIATKYGECDVMVTFVPTKEIGKVMSKYKNAILKYNPRNFLSLSRNKVNQSIRNSIITSDTNDFSLLNNGITMIATKYLLTEATGMRGRGTIIVYNPQILNGGQTAYTLSQIYDSGNIAKLDNKEVLLKIIIVDENNKEYFKFIEELSNATNQQNKIEEADRRSNNHKMITIQREIYNEFGYLLERKRGEFFNGLENGYISKDIIIERGDFLRSYMAYQGNARWARQRGGDNLFKEDNFNSTFANPEEYKSMFFAYRIFTMLFKEDQMQNESKWGLGLQYGKHAIIAAIGIYKNDILISKDTLDEMVIKYISIMRDKWNDFEIYAKDNDKRKTYIRKGSFDYDLYYKGKTIDKDILQYFGKKIA